MDTVIFYGQDIAGLAQLASQMFQLGHVFQKTAEEDQFEDMVKQVKESLKTGPNPHQGKQFHAFSQIGRGIRKSLANVKEVIQK